MREPYYMRHVRSYVQVASTPRSSSRRLFSAVTLQPLNNFDWDHPELQQFDWVLCEP